MKCPECNDEGMVNENSPSCVIYRKYWCGRCNHEWDERKLIDPTELRELVEKALDSKLDDPGWGRWNAFKAVLSAMDGRPARLKQLAGGEE